MVLISFCAIHLSSGIDASYLHSYIFYLATRRTIGVNNSKIEPMKIDKKILISVAIAGLSFGQSQAIAASAEQAPLASPAMQETLTHQQIVEKIALLNKRAQAIREKLIKARTLQTQQPFLDYHFAGRSIPVGHVGDDVKMLKYKRYLPKDHYPEALFGVSATVKMSYHDNFNDKNQARPFAYKHSIAKFKGAVNFNSWLAGAAYYALSDSGRDELRVANFTIGDLNRSPFYFAVGRKYIDFGLMNAPYVDESTAEGQFELVGNALTAGYAGEHIVATVSALQGENSSSSYNGNKALNGSINAWNSQLVYATRGGLFDRFKAGIGYASDVRGFEYNHLATARGSSASHKIPEGTLFTNFTIGSNEIYATYSKTLDGVLGAEINDNQRFADSHPWGVSLAFTHHFDLFHKWNGVSLVYNTTGGFNDSEIDYSDAAKSGATPYAAMRNQVSLIWDLPLHKGVYLSSEIYGGNWYRKHQANSTDFESGTTRYIGTAVEINVSI